MKRTLKRKTPINREHKKPKHIQNNSIFTEYDLSYLNIIGINTKGLPNPCPVEIIDGNIKIMYNGKTETLW